VASPVHAEAGAAPAVLPHEAVPRRRRGPDLAQPLGEDGERAGRDVAIFGRGQQSQHEPEQCHELPHPSSQLDNLLSEFRLRELRHIQTDNDRWRLAEPPRAVERGTPRSVATVTSPVRCTRFRSRWS
jgi:hypothetical protein